MARERGGEKRREEEVEVTEAMMCKEKEMEKEGKKVGDKRKGKVLRGKKSRKMENGARGENELIESEMEEGCRCSHQR